MDYLVSSRFIQLILNLRKNLQKRIFSSRTAKTAAYLTKRLRREFYLLPLKISGTIMIIVIFTNILFSFVFRKEITLSGWIMRLLLFLMAFGSLGCPVSWEKLKARSIFFRKWK